MLFELHFLLCFASSPKVLLSEPDWRSDLLERDLRAVPVTDFFGADAKVFPTTSPHPLAQPPEQPKSAHGQQKSGTGVFQTRPVGQVHVPKEDAESAKFVPVLGSSGGGKFHVLN